MPGRVINEIAISGILWQKLWRDLAEVLDQVGQILDQVRVARLSPVAAFVHIERSVDLDLQGMAMCAWPAIKASREPSGVRRVDRDLEPAADKEAVGNIDDPRSASGAITIAEHDVGAILTASRGGRHRMAVDEQITAEIADG